MDQAAALSKRERRKQCKHLPDLRLTALGWVGPLCTALGIALSIIEGL
jgi:hypothetical protein